MAVGVFDLLHRRVAGGVRGGLGGSIGRIRGGLGGRIARVARRAGAS